MASLSKLCSMIAWDLLLDVSNVQLCCARFSMCLADATGSLFSVRAIDDVCTDKLDDGVIRNVELHYSIRDNKR